MATRTPARGRFRAQANTGRASSSNPMAASRRSIERSKGLQSRLSAVAWGKSGARREAGDGAAEGRASIGVLRVREAVADIASEPPTCGRNGRERRLGSGPVAEGVSNIVLIRVSRFEKRHHGISFRSAVLGGVMGKDDAMNQDRSLISLGLDANVMVHHGATRKENGSRQKFGLLGRRTHDRAAWLTGPK